MWTHIFGCLWSFGVAGVFVFAGSFPKKPPGGTGCFHQSEKFYALLQDCAVCHHFDHYKALLGDGY